MTEEQMQALNTILKECAEKEKATQADIDDFLAGKPAIEPQAKCHRACLHETFGTVSISFLLISLRGFHHIL